MVLPKSAGLWRILILKFSLVGYQPLIILIPISIVLYAIMMALAVSFQMVWLFKFVNERFSCEGKPASGFFSLGSYKF
jgi:hypothetical protein